MGTIGDLLGDALGQALASNAENTPVDAIEGAREKAQEERSAHVREVVVSAVRAHTSFEESQLRDGLSLEELDLDTLSLYAIVTAIEHELNISIEDAIIADWHTFGDIFASVDELTH